MEDLVLRCKNLNYNIGYKKIFQNLNFEIFKNDKILLQGENGVGKSTLLQLILNYNKNSSFEFKTNKNQNHLSYLGHKNGYYANLSLSTNLEYFNSILNFPISKEIILNYLKLFNLEKRISDKISIFSEGMKKKVGIIRALISKPSLLLLDEPFNSLDENSCNVLTKLLKEEFQNSSILIVSHDPKPVLEFANKKMILKDKSIQYV